MPARFLVVPQWQGSGSSRAMRLIDGAEAIRGDLPSAATVEVEVPVEAGESLETGVARCSSVATVADRASVALAGMPGPVVTVGGDCGADLAPVRHALARRDAGDVALVWFDAHGDANSAETSPSGAFGGMVVRALLGDGPRELVASGDAVLPVPSLVLAGVRALDDGEAEFLDTAGVAPLGPDAATPDALVAAVEATGASAVYVHVDLDVLDPEAIACVSEPEPFGMTVGALTDGVRALRERFELVGGAVCGFAPPSLAHAQDDLPTVLRVLGSLTAPVR